MNNYRNENIPSVFKDHYTARTISPSVVRSLSEPPKNEKLHISEALPCSKKYPSNNLALVVALLLFMDMV